MPIFTLELRSGGAPIAASYQPTLFYLTSPTETIVVGPVTPRQPTTHGYIEIDEVELSCDGWSKCFSIGAPGGYPNTVNRVQNGSEVTILLRGPSEATMVTRSREEVAAMAQLMASIP